MPTNPNNAFKARHRVSPDNYKDLAGMMISLYQKRQLTGLVWKLGISWADLCMSTLRKHKNMSDCTFYEAARCLVAAGVWKNREETGIE